MNINYNLYFKCLLSRIPFSFVNNLSQDVKNYNILVQPQTLYFLTVHLRFSSLFYATQLVEVFSYEVPLAYTNVQRSFVSKSDSSLVVYNYHSMLTQDRFFIFMQPGASYTNSTLGGSQVQSIAELFSSANWLEREIAELSGLTFNGKKDLRNLMLQYGDSSAPFQKSFPTIGLREMFYNPVKDTIVQSPVTIQL